MPQFYIEVGTHYNDMLPLLNAGEHESLVSPRSPVVTRQAPAFAGRSPSVARYSVRACHGWTHFQSLG